MKTSFYFVLWQLAGLPAIIFDIPFFNEYGFFFICVLVFLTDYILRKLLKNQIEYQKIREVAYIMEMAYNNDYKRYKRQALLQMVVNTAGFVYLLLLFIALFTFYSNVPLIDYILWGTFMILAGISSSWHIRYYLQVRKAGGITLDKELQDIYISYKEERDTHTYEEILLPHPKHYQAINAANILFAILCIVLGLLITIILYIYSKEFNSGTELYQLGLSIYGILAIYWGVKDLLSIPGIHNYILLLLSCAIAALLYKPITHYINRDILITYIADDPNLEYDAKDNLVKRIIISDEIKDDIETTYLKQRSMLCLSTNDEKKLLKKTIRIGAEFQVIYRDEQGNEQSVIISSSELKEIYRQTKSNFDIFIELLKLDFGVSKAKVYEDGEYIIIEYWVDENIPYPIQSEYQDFVAFLANFTKRCAEYYGIAVFNRGLKIRFFFNDDKIIEHTLSLDKLKKEEEQFDLEESNKDSLNLFNHIFK